MPAACAPLACCLRAAAYLDLLLPPLSSLFPFCKSISTVVDVFVLELDSDRIHAGGNPASTGPQWKSFGEGTMLAWDLAGEHKQEPTQAPAHSGNLWARARPRLGFLLASTSKNPHKHPPIMEILVREYEFRGGLLLVSTSKRPHKRPPIVEILAREHEFRGRLLLVSTSKNPHKRPPILEILVREYEFRAGSCW